MLIKKDILNYTQARSDKVLANVGGGGFFLKVTVSLFIKV